MKFPKLYMLYAVIALVLLIGAGFYIFKPVTSKDIPTNFILQVPFSAQAPTDNWSRNEDCEETSLVMANAFLTGNRENELTASSTQEAINIIKKWEQANLGYNADTGADATTKMAQNALILRVRQIKDFTEADLKTELINGHPILLPINAKLLGSPQYLENGPTYHMIVIKGFKGDTFIVNDPGTNDGNGNEYSFSTLQKASADWNNAAKKMDPTVKIALVLSK